MFDRPTDTWYMYMRPFRVALLLQLRNLQQNIHQKEEKVKQNNEKQPQSSTP